LEGAGLWSGFITAVGDRGHFVPAHYGGCWVTRRSRAWCGFAPHALQLLLRYLTDGNSGGSIPARAEKML
jgi:hypothetical protein